MQFSFLYILSSTVGKSLLKGVTDCLCRHQPRDSRINDLDSDCQRGLPSALRSHPCRPPVGPLSTSGVIRELRHLWRPELRGPQGSGGNDNPCASRQSYYEEQWRFLRFTLVVVGIGITHVVQALCLLDLEARWAGLEASWLEASCTAEQHRHA